MAKKEKQIELVDHRSMGIDLGLGGTRRPFLIEALPRGGVLVKVMDGEGNTAEIKVRYEIDSMFEVTYGSGLKAVYDYTGNLLRVEFGMAAYMNALPEEILAQFTQDSQEAAVMLLENDTDIRVEVDLKDGLVAGDRRGWVQVTPDDGACRVDESIGGWEVTEGQPAVTRKIDVTGPDGELIGALGVRVESRNGFLALGVGDICQAATFRLRQLANPDLLAYLKTPRGTYRFLQHLRFTP